MVSVQNRPLIAGNWKMFKTTAEAVQFTEALAEKLRTSTIPQTTLPDIMLCPPFTVLSVVKEAVKRLNVPFQVAAQTMESQEQGAFTGEVSPLMLKDLGIDAVVIGHSERRQYYNETDKTVNAKTKAALKHGLKPVVCVGETLEQREAGTTDTVVERQVTQAVEGITPTDLEKVVFAYEPVWAIGTGKTCEAREANRVCGLIRNLLRPILSGKGDAAKIRILYGGSVKPDNASELMQQPEMNGALVGGASLEADSFFKIIQSACTVSAS